MEIVKDQTYSNCLCVSRFSLVDPGNIVRLLAPDVGLCFSVLFVVRLCKKLVRPVPQVNLHENGIPPSDPEVMVNTFINLYKLLYMKYA